VDCGGDSICYNGKNLCGGGAVVVLVLRLDVVK